MIHAPAPTPTTTSTMLHMLSTSQHCTSKSTHPFVTYQSTVHNDAITYACAPHHIRYYNNVYSRTSYVQAWIPTTRTHMHCSLLFLHVTHRPIVSLVLYSFSDAPSALPKTYVHPRHTLSSVWVFDLVKMRSSDNTLKQNLLF